MLAGLLEGVGGVSLGKGSIDRMIMQRNNAIDGLKVARISTVAFFVQTQLRSQIEAIAGSGADVTVIASESSLEYPIPSVKYLSVRMPRRISVIEDGVALFRLWRIFRQERFDVVHSTTPKAGLLCALAGWAARVPVRVHTFTGQPWVEMSGLKRFLAKTSERMIGWLNTENYADSFSQRDYLVRERVVDEGRIEVIGSGSLAGVDLNRFSSSRFEQSDKDLLREKLGIAESSLILLFVGRVVRDKGVRELVEAFDSLVSKHVDVALVLVGPDEDRLESMFMKVSAAALKRVIRVGFSDKPEQYMAIADALVIPSYREGFGTVVIEAAAMGVPAVGTRIYGLSDAIVEGETGLLVEPKNAAELSSTLERLLIDDKLRCTMGCEAQRRAEKCFDSKIINDLVVREYARLWHASARRGGV